MKLKIIGDCIPDVDFSNIGYEVIDSDSYDIILSSFNDNTTTIVGPNNSLAMVIYTKEVPRPESQNYICSRTKNAKAVMIEGDFQFYRQLYRYREAVFFCHRDKRKAENEYKRMFDWLMWEKTVNHLTLEQYIKQLIKEGVCAAHCVGDPDYYAPQFRGDKYWETKRQTLDGVTFTGWDTKIIEVPISKLIVYQFRDSTNLEAFRVDPLQHPKAENNAPSWKRLFYGIAKKGVASPVRAYKYKNGKIIMTKGKHRYIAAKKLGCKTIPAVIAYEV